MIVGKTVMALVPARAGSKRVINKNVRDVCGKPLIGWTFEALKESRYIDEVYVSTDSLDVQAIADRYKLRSRPARPDYLASDTAGMVDVVLHALSIADQKIDILVLLQPTSPLRIAKDIDAAIALFIEKQARSVISVCEVEADPSWMLPLPEDHSLKLLRQKIKKQRSQDLEKHYRLNGALYVIDVENFLSEKEFISSEGCYAYVMPKSRSIDIDSEEDLYIAECLLRGQSSLPKPQVF